MRVMHNLSRVPRSWTVIVAVTVTGVACRIWPSQNGVAAPAASAPRVSATTNAEPQNIEVPKSIFVVPATAQDGKDPFFPQSTRLRPAPRLIGTTAPPVVPELELKGISGTASRRLAIINNRTFERGEEGDVMCNGNRVHVRCVEIESDSVQVTFNGQAKVLRLRTRL
jgi:hypothetical protein